MLSLASIVSALASVFTAHHPAFTSAANAKFANIASELGQLSNSMNRYMNESPISTELLRRLEEVMRDLKGVLDDEEGDLRKRVEEESHHLEVYNEVISEIEKATSPTSHAQQMSELAFVAFHNLLSTPPSTPEPLLSSLENLILLTVSPLKTSLLLLSRTSLPDLSLIRPSLRNEIQSLGKVADELGCGISDWYEVRDNENDFGLETAADGTRLEKKVGHTFEVLRGRCESLVEDIRSLGHNVETAKETSEAEFEKLEKKLKLLDSLRENVEGLIDRVESDIRTDTSPPISFTSLFTSQPNSQFPTPTRDRLLNFATSFSAILSRPLPYSNSDADFLGERDKLKQDQEVFDQACRDLEDAEEGSEEELDAVASLRDAVADVQEEVQNALRVYQIQVQQEMKVVPMYLNLIRVMIKAEVHEFIILRDDFDQLRTSLSQSTSNATKKTFVDDLLNKLDSPLHEILSLVNFHGFEVSQAAKTKLEHYRRVFVTEADDVIAAFALGRGNVDRMVARWQADAKDFTIEMQKLWKETSDLSHELQHNIVHWIAVRDTLKIQMFKMKHLMMTTDFDALCSVALGEDTDE